MENLPVFDSAEEYRTWKTLNGKISEKILDDISTRILTSDGFIHPAILISLMDTMVRERGRIPSETVRTIVSKSRPQDCTPVIRATEILVSQEDITTAAELLSKSESRDSFQLYLAKAELYHGEGDRINSVDSAKKGLEIDPTNKRLYEILIEDDPSGHWKDIESVSAASEKEEAPTPEDERLKELYLIYKNWYRGNKDSATNRLINSPYYKDGDWEFLLVSARTSVDETDWRSAKMVYQKILEKAPTYVKLEAAEAYIAGHEPDEALEIYDDLGMSSIRVLRGRIWAYAHMGAEGDLINAIYDYLDNENCGSSDYADMIDMLIPRGALDDVRELLERMARSNRKDPCYLLSNSKYLLQIGDVRGATRTAAKAAMIAKDDPSVRVMSARMKFINNDLKNASKECDRLLAEDPQDIDAMMLKKDILIRKEDIDGALDVCRHILDLNPNDVGTMFTLATAMSAAGDMNGATMTLRNVLRLEPSRENVLNVVGSMIEEGLYRDAMFLCYELERDIAPDPMIRRLRGNTEYAMGDYMKASVSFAAAAELAPDDPVIWHSKGMADEARGDLVSAAASYDRAISLDLNEPQYWISKASIQEKNNDPNGAVDSLNRAIELDSESTYPVVRKAMILEDAGRYREALYLVDICMEMDPEDEGAALMKSRILRESNANERAVALAREVYDRTGSEDAALELASCYLAVHKRPQALDVISSALAEYPDSARLKSAMESVEEGSTLIPDGLEEEEKTTTEDPEAIVEIAESMLAIGEYRGALRHIDRAISLAGDRLEYIVLKSRTLTLLGETSNAQSLIADTMKENPKSAILHEAMGDIKFAKSEYRAALQSYEKAMSLGLALPELLVKKGDAQQGLGYFDRSIDSYSMAVSRAPEDIDLHYAFAVKLYDRGYLSRARKEVLEILEQAPEDARTIILYAKIERDSRKDYGVTDAYKRFKAGNIRDAGYIREMVEVLNSTGHDDEAKNLSKDEPESPDSIRIKRSAEKVLRRAYVSRAAPDDDDLLLSLGYEGEELEELQKYIRKEAPYGDIVPGSKEFQKMERMSNDLILKLNWKDIEERPKLPLERVFVTGSFKDIEEAKRLVSYVSKAMSANVIRDDSLRIVLDRVQGTTIFEIMRACKVGVYQARQIQLLMGIQ